MKEPNELPHAFAFMEDVVDLHLVNGAPRWVIFFLGRVGHNIIALALGSQWYSPQVVGPVTPPSEDNLPLVLHITAMLPKSDGASGVAQLAHRQ